ALAASRARGGMGRSLIAFPLSIASCFFSAAVLGPRFSPRSEGSAATSGSKHKRCNVHNGLTLSLCPQRAHIVFMWPKALLRSRLHPRPIGQLSHPRRCFGWTSVKDSSGGDRLLGPAEWLA